MASIRCIPHSVNPFRDKSRILYYVSPLDGTPSYTLDSADMLHLPSLGFDGLRSPSPITFAGREAVGTAIAAQEYTGRFFAGGANIDYALKTASRLGDKQLADLKASVIARAQNGGRGPLILSGGLEPAQLSINSKDAEILATKLFNVEEISRILGVPPHMIGHTSKSTSLARASSNRASHSFATRCNATSRRSAKRSTARSGQSARSTSLST